MQKVNNNLFWKDRNVLLTGAHGFIGGNLAKFFINNGANVFAIVRSHPVKGFLFHERLDNKVRTFQIPLYDVTSLAALLSEFSISTVFHLAAQVEIGVGMASPYGTFESNIRGTYSLLEACRLSSPQPKSIVVASTDKSYGAHDVSQMPYTEDHALNAKFPYDVSKASADMISRAYAQYPHSLPVVVTRFANIFGPGQLNFSAIMPSLYAHKYTDNEFKPRSDGSQARDFIFIDDVVELYSLISQALFERPKDFSGMIFNAGSGFPISIFDLVAKVNKLITLQNYDQILNDFSLQRKPYGEIDIQYMGYDLVNKCFGWSPSTSIDDGILIANDWYEKYFNHAS